MLLTKREFLSGIAGLVAGKPIAELVTDNQPKSITGYHYWLLPFPAEHEHLTLRLIPLAAGSGRPLQNQKVYWVGDKFEVTTYCQKVLAGEAYAVEPARRAAWVRVA